MPILQLPRDIWLEILDQLITDDYCSLRHTCKALNELIIPIIWSKLEICDVRSTSREPLNRWDKQTYLDWISNGRTKRKVWTSLDVETVDSLYQQKCEAWFRTRLGHVKTLIISFFNKSLQEAHLEALAGPYKKGDIDWLAGAFH